ncbi:hypothetical protein SAMN06295905_1626 [Devosia lucknowensis]|uniref:ACT domain-containing protein n=1 Tax=Devosia lucknowensis TaxID=1096929 RepID=A0A1Y6F5S9_9HYPH|nr:hypothetical protein [Devosia lucknowensis]SMQ68680.1 hypothetical protein SAMN06295905_1626 [Devosia lucknowensis]
MRNRIAIAHFPSPVSALRVRLSLISQGGTATAFPEEHGNDESCRLRVVLSPKLERRLLDLLLGSDALRVDVHDA